MSVLIKGMEMPKAGNWKTIRIYYDGTCAEPNWQGDCRYMQGCEAVSVPPHGRLIDADSMIKRLEAHEARHKDEPVYPLTFKDLFDAYIYDLEHETTIIEAEEEQE